LDILPDRSAAGTIFESIKIFGFSTSSNFQLMASIIHPFTVLKPGDDFVVWEARVFYAIILKLKPVLSHL
jgi:hypothetical protein